MGGRLCFFDFVYNYGGGQRSTVDLIANVSGSDIEVLIADAHGECNEFLNAARANALSTMTINKCNNTAIGKQNKFKRFLMLFTYTPVYLQTCFRLREYLKSQDVKFVWSNSFKGLFAIFLATIFSEVKIGLFIRAEGMLKNLGYLKRHILQHRIDHILVQSTLIEGKVTDLGVKSTKIHIVSNAIPRLELLINKDDIRPFKVKPDSLTVILPATIIPAKGIKEAIEAIGIFKKKSGVPIHLYLAGKTGDFGKNSGNFMRELTSFIDSLQLGANVEFLGHRDNILSLMQLVDIVMLPSYAEGMPRVIMEGMLAGKAVIGTNVGAIPELISDNYTGLIIPPKNSEAIAVALSQLVDKEFRNILGMNAQRYISENYSLENQVEQFTSFLKQLNKA